MVVQVVQEIDGSVKVVEKATAYSESAIAIMTNDIAKLCKATRHNASSRAPESLLRQSGKHIQRT